MKVNKCHDSYGFLICGFFHTSNKKIFKETFNFFSSICPFTFMLFILFMILNVLRCRSVIYQILASKSSIHSIFFKTFPENFCDGFPFYAIISLKWLQLYMKMNSITSGFFAIYAEYLFCITQGNTNYFFRCQKLVQAYYIAFAIVLICSRFLLVCECLGLNLKVQADALIVVLAVLLPPKH